jgi:hypothetical protein
MVHIYMVQFDSSIREIEPAWRAIRLRYTQTESAHIRILGTTDEEFSSPASTAIAGGN